MSFLSSILRQPVEPSSLHEVPARPILIIWSDEVGEIVAQRAQLELDRTCGLTVVVPQQPPPNSVAQVREMGSVYPVEILSVCRVDQGFKLQLDYLSEGRRGLGRPT